MCGEQFLSVCLRPTIGALNQCEGEEDLEKVTGHLKAVINL